MCEKALPTTSRRWPALLPLLFLPLTLKEDGAWNHYQPTSRRRSANPQRNTAILAGGCFWCVESALEQLKGVSDVTSGYAGGKAETATYKMSASAGRTKHAEVVRVTFDPSVISYAELLRVFMSVHDPTQLNRQGADIGRHYRSAIFPQNDQQKEIAENYISLVQESGSFKKPIVTTIETGATFYLAEDYHQDYAENNPQNPYIRAVSEPKRQKACQLYPE